MKFFRIQLAEIRALVDSQGLEAHWTMKAEAAEYRESLAAIQAERRAKQPGAVRDEGDVVELVPT